MITGFVEDDKYLSKVELADWEQKIIDAVLSQHINEGCSTDIDMHEIMCGSSGIDLNRIRQFAMHNFCADEDEQFTVEEEEFNVSNPWIDRSGRFALTDEGAVRERGLETVVKFCIGVMKEVSK